MARLVSGYRLARRAEADLESIYDFSWKTWSSQQADKYYGELIAGFEDLASGAKIGRDAELGDGVLKQLLGSHVVFYKVGEGSIDILRILHQSMDIVRHMD